MLCFIYSAGLRRGELLNLLKMDIDSMRMIKTKLNAKGMKDRTVPLSPVVLTKLRNSYVEFKPKKYYFEGQYGVPYGKRSLELV